MVSEAQDPCMRVREKLPEGGRWTAGRASAGILVSLVMLFLEVLGAILVAVSPAAVRAESLAVPVASHARIRGDSRATRFEADLTFAIPFNVYVKKDPYRVFIDLPAVDFRFGPNAGRKGRGLIRAFRYGRMGEDRARIVLDVTGPVLIRRSYVRHARNGVPARMGVELIRTDPETFSALMQETEMLHVRKKTHGRGSSEDVVDSERKQVASAYRHLIEQALRDEVLNPTNKARGGIEMLLEDDPLSLDRGASRMSKGRIQPKDIHSSTASGGQAAKSARSGTTPRKAGGHGAALEKVKKAQSTRRPLIVIDPGHGGKDPGAIGWKNVKEKDLVLAFARDLALALRRSGGVRVLLTHSGDTFLTLRQRVDFARRHNAQLFISIHADKFRTGAARGLAVYTLSEDASDEEAAELARSENAADIIDGVDLGVEAEAVKDILIDLAMRETKNRSAHFARMLAQSLKGAVKLRTRPIRSADFRVLRNPDVPAVLVELGYVSNPRDVRNMKSAAWRRKAAAAMARAVKRHLETQVALERP